CRGESSRRLAIRSDHPNGCSERRLGARAPQPGGGFHRPSAPCERPSPSGGDGGRSKREKSCHGGRLPRARGFELVFVIGSRSPTPLKIDSDVPLLPCPFLLRRHS